MPCLERHGAGNATIRLRDQLQHIVMAGDDRSYAGATTLDAGRSVALHLTILGGNELILVNYQEGHSYSDVPA
ncbi:MAG TPA: hypothetical protein VJ820_20755 [Propionibacteriaceae bacterium]|nr:hypothetical protein [Propionibacteriaceae bacterium]